MLKKFIGLERVYQRLILIVASILLIAASIGIYFFKRDSADGRLLIWKVTSRMIMESPWAGHGHDRFAAKYMAYQADYFRQHQTEAEAFLADDTFYAFNDPLQFVSENGVIGLVLASVLLVVLFLTKGHTDNEYLITIADYSGKSDPPIPVIV
ncbi:MAG: O-antigen ligase family protein [Cyclobacteriaceae bacterium]|nr:O-antigen ligase family protein [Cyclobacteriaceae bacterium]